MRIVFFGLFLVSLYAVISCNKANELPIKTGTWKGYLKVKDNKELPFIFRFSNDQFIIKNGIEEIVIDEYEFNNGIIKFNFPVYDAHIKINYVKDGLLKGHYAKAPKFRKVAFRAVYGEKERFNTKFKAGIDISGKWQVRFGLGEQAYEAIALFDQDEDRLTGTFLTETGDYRYLEGNVSRDSRSKDPILRLSTFDGSHAFLFDAVIKEDGITNGNFYSGNHYKNGWVAVRNEQFELTDPEQLTGLIDNSKAIDFSFKDLSGNLISLSDKKYRDRPVIIQLMGSWCPNCLDESKFLASYYKEENEVPIIALAFENAKTEEKALANLNRLRSTLDIQYDILLAGYDIKSKAEAGAQFPLIKELKSYPTTLFLNSKKEVIKIHTGFNGPATGAAYEKFKDNFYSTLEKLKAEG